MNKKYTLDFDGFNESVQGFRVRRGMDLGLGSSHEREKKEGWLALNGLHYPGSWILFPTQPLS